MALMTGAQPYFNALVALMPPGIALNPESDELSDLLTKTANELLLVSHMEEELFAEQDPRDSKYLLAEWEASFGLPDKCMLKGSQTFEERRRSVYAKFVDAGGARRTRYETLLQALGYENATIERCRLYTCETPIDQPLYEDPEWRFNWFINMGADSDIKEWTCEAPCDEHLRVWGDNITECVINRENSITSQVLFGYGESVL